MIKKKFYFQGKSWNLKFYCIMMKLCVLKGKFKNLTKLREIIKAKMI